MPETFELTEEDIKTIDELKERTNDIWRIKGYLKEHQERVKRIPTRFLNRVIKVDGYKFILHEGKIYFNANYYHKRIKEEKNRNDI